MNDRVAFCEPSRTKERLAAGIGFFLLAVATIRPTWSAELSQVPEAPPVSASLDGEREPSVLSEPSRTGLAGTAEAPAPDLQQGLTSNVYFSSGGADVSVEGIAVILPVSEKLKADHRQVVDLIGHADDSGSAEYCLALAARRANAVAAVLVTLGVHSAQMRTASWGCEAPEQICDSESCHAAERRVELRIEELRCNLSGPC